MREQVFRAQDLTEDLVLEAAVELYQEGRPDITDMGVFMRIAGYGNAGFVYWPEQRATFELLKGLERQGYLKDRQAAIKGIFDWVDPFSELNRARRRLGLPEGPPTYRRSEKVPELSGSAQEVVKILLERHQRQEWVTSDAELKELYPFSGPVLHEAVLELIPSGVFESSFRVGGPYYWLEDPEAARLAVKVPEPEARARGRLSPFACSSWA